MPTSRITRRDENHALDEADRAFWAARRLHMVAAVLIAISTVGMAVLIGLGTVLITRDSDPDQNTGVALITEAIVGELEVLLVCFATQAFARYMEWRTTKGV